MITLTAEQEAIRAGAATGDPGKVEAYAGAGKTFTLREIALSRPQDRALYLAFNKVTADEARAKMPPNVESRTTHSLAFSGTKKWRGYRPVVGSWWRLKQDLFHAEGDTIDSCRIYGRSADHAFSAIAATLSRFCNSADERPGPQHVPHDVLDPIVAAAIKLDGEPATEQGWRTLERGIRDRLAKGATRLWDVILTRADWPVTHDLYLKYWQLQRPQIPADLIMFDEAQDAAPVQQAIVLGQRGRVWMVGDPYQAIYEWRGAIDALSQFEAPSYPLSRSWRFGELIAATAGQVLDVWHVDPRLSGGGAPGRVVGLGEAGIITEAGFAAPGPEAQEAVLCRTNMGVLAAALGYLDARRAVAVTGGADALADLIEGAVTLYRGGEPRHPDLRDFTTWEELVILSDVPGGESWKPIVRLVQDGPDAAALSAARLRRETVPESAASVVVSTGHKAKGRQWGTVRLWNDWKPFQGVDENGMAFRKDEEARLWYVAMTRPTHVLDMTMAATAWSKNWDYPGTATTETAC